jgi:hypothetical protein
MPHLPPAHHEASKHDSPNKLKIKEKQNEIVPDSMHENQHYGASQGIQAYI